MLLDLRKEHLRLCRAICSLVRKSFSPMCFNPKQHMQDHGTQRHSGKCVRKYATMVTNLGTSHGSSFKRQYCSRAGLSDRKNCPPWDIVFFGSDGFSVNSLKFLADKCQNKPGSIIKSLSVVTMETTPVQTYAVKRGLPIHTWPFQPQVGQFDVGVLVSFGKLIPARVINAFPYGIINVHPSLLPRWRGACPGEHTIWCGDEEAGVSIMKIEPKEFDGGPVLLQNKVAVPANCYRDDLYDLLSQLGNSMLEEVLHNLPTMDAMAVKQPSIGITHARKLTLEDGYVDWSNEAKHEIERKYRAFHGKIPMKTMYKDKELGLLSMCHPPKLTDEFLDVWAKRLYDENVLPGCFLYMKNQECICIKCKDGWLCFQEFKYPNKQKANDFYSRYLSKRYTSDNRCHCNHYHSNHSTQ